MANYLVTGGAGFIGSNIVYELVKKKHNVIVFDDLSTGSLNNLAAVRKAITFKRGDIRRLSSLRSVMKQVDYVLHQAALRSVPRSVDDPVSTNDVNVTGTLNVLLAAKACGVKRVVYASSSSVYGDSLIIPQKETQSLAPVSPYAVSKLAGELYCRVFAKTFRLETVCLRYFNVFGPNQNPQSKYAAVIPLFMRQAYTGKPLTVHGDGKQSRDFTYVDNVVYANILAATKPGVSGEAFNVALGDSNSLLDIIAIIEELTGKKLTRAHSAPRIGDIRKTRADNTKIIRKLGFKPRVSFAEGIKKTWAAFVNRGDW